MHMTKTTTMLPSHFRPPTEKPETSDRSGERSKANAPIYGVRPKPEPGAPAKTSNGPMPKRG
jgi:hypothetical protein